MTRRSGLIGFLLVAGLLVLPSAAQACHDQDKGKAPFEAQEQAMLCLVNHARTTRGLPPLTATLSLIKAADHKSRTSSAATNSATKPAAANSPTG